MTNLITGAVIFAVGAVFGVAVYRHAMSITSKLIEKSKSNIALDEEPVVFRQDRTI